MRIKNVMPQPDRTLIITTENDKEVLFDVNPFLCYEAFEELKDIESFMAIRNGGYFIEWECGADLSADTIEAKMKEKKPEKEVA
jgi:hypothetical protein